MNHIETYSGEAICWCGSKVIGVPGEGGGVYKCPKRVTKRVLRIGKLFKKYLTDNTGPR